MQFFRVFLFAILLLLQNFAEASSINRAANSLENANEGSQTLKRISMNALEDAAKHLKRRGACEHAIHVVSDATAYHLVPMAIRKFVHVMHDSRPMPITLNALKLLVEAIHFKRDTTFNSILTVAID